MNFPSIKWKSIVYTAVLIFWLIRNMPSVSDILSHIEYFVHQILVPNIGRIFDWTIGATLFVLWVVVLVHSLNNSKLRGRFIWTTLNLAFLPSILYFFLHFLPSQKNGGVPSSKGVVEGATYWTKISNSQERQHIFDYTYGKFEKYHEAAVEAELSTERYLLGINAAAIVAFITVGRFYQGILEIGYIKYALPILFVGIILVGLVKSVRIVLNYIKKGTYENERIRFLNGEISLEDLELSDYITIRSPTLIIVLGMMALICYVSSAALIAYSLYTYQSS